jgi:hypothetical protein
LFHLFYLAEALGKTVDELLTGKPQPLSTTELRYWIAYRGYKFEVQNQADEENLATMQQKNSEAQQQYITMGSKT